MEKLTVREIEAKARDKGSIGNDPRIKMTKLSLIIGFTVGV